MFLVQEPFYLEDLDPTYAQLCIESYLLVCAPQWAQQTLKDELGKGHAYATKSWERLCHLAADCTVTQTDILKASIISLQNKEVRELNIKIQF